MMHAPVVQSVPVPPAELAEAGAAYRKAVAAAQEAFRATGHYRAEVQVMYAAAVKYSLVAGAVLASGLFGPEAYRWSAIADSALWEAVKMGGHE